MFLCCLCWVAEWRAEVGRLWFGKSIWHSGSMLLGRGEQTEYIPLGNVLYGISRVTLSEPISCQKIVIHVHHHNYADLLENDTDSVHKHIDDALIHSFWIFL